jgi:hypothetical protein
VDSQGPDRDYREALLMVTERLEYYTWHDWRLGFTHGLCWEYLYEYQLGMDPSWLDKLSRTFRPYLRALPLIETQCAVAINLQLDESQKVDPW